MKKQKNIIALVTQADRLQSKIDQWKDTILPVTIHIRIIDAINARKIQDKTPVTSLTNH